MNGYTQDDPFWDECSEDDPPWDETSNIASEQPLSDVKEEPEQKFNEEAPKPSEANLEPKKLKLPPPEAEAGERECGALWPQKGSHGQRFNGDIVIEGSKYKISVLPNLHYRGPRNPTHRIFWH